MGSRKQQILDRAFNRDYSSVPQVPLISTESPSKWTIKVTDSPEKSYLDAVSPLTRPPRLPHESLNCDESLRAEVLLSSEESVCSEETARPRCVIKPLSDKKPIPFRLLENYIREVCDQMERNNWLTLKTIHKASVMVKALDDCTVAIPNLSLHFYNLARGILEEIGRMDESCTCELVSERLLDLASFIYEKRFRSNERPVVNFNFQSQEPSEPLTLKGIKKKVQALLHALTAKHLVHLKKPKKDCPSLNTLLQGFLKVIKLLDKTLDLKAPDPFAALARFTAVPGVVVQTYRRLFILVETERIPVEAILSLHKKLQSLSPAALSKHDKSGVANTLLVFLQSVVKYYDLYAVTHYGRSVLPPAKEEEESLLFTPIKGNPSFDTTKPSPSFESHQFSPIRARAASVKPRRKRPKPHVFSSPEKQQLYHSILGQQKLHEIFRQFLRDRLVVEMKQFPDSKRPDVDAMRCLINEKKLVVNSFLKKYKLKKEDYDRLMEHKSFLQDLDNAAKLMDNPNFIQPPKPPSYFNKGYFNR